MQTIALKARTDSDGVMKLEVTTDLVDQELEIILVMQPSGVKATDSMGYPLGYFEETYGSFADEPLERNQPKQLDMRDTIE